MGESGRNDPRFSFSRKPSRHDDRDTHFRTRIPEARDTGGISSSLDLSSAGTAPQYVRLVRNGNTISAYYGNSPTGPWTFTERVNVAMTGTDYIGLVVVSSIKVFPLPQSSPTFRLPRHHLPLRHPSYRLSHFLQIPLLSLRGRTPRSPGLRQTPHLALQGRLVGYQGNEWKPDRHPRSNCYVHTCLHGGGWQCD